MKPFSLLWTDMFDIHSMKTILLSSMKLNYLVKLDVKLTSNIYKLIKDNINISSL